MVTSGALARTGLFGGMGSLPILPGVRADGASHASALLRQTRRGWLESRPMPACPVRAGDLRRG
eukprot:9610695-Heterocapsa_arctica.AAC.1